jgi:hypothetical protein
MCEKSGEKKVAGSPGVEEPRAKDHDGFAGALLELYLDGLELLVDDLDHPLDFFRRDRPRSTLFTKQIHHVRRELATRLQKTPTTTTTN